MIRKLIVAMVAAAMLVVMAVPAYAQNGPQLVPNQPNNEELNFALNNLEQECEIDQENNTVVVQDNEQNNEQNQAGVVQSGQGFIVINHNDGDVDQEQNNEQNAENNALVVPINANSGDVECDAAIVNLQDVLALFLFGGPERNGGPNSA